MVHTTDNRTRGKALTQRGYCQIEPSAPGPSKSNDTEDAAEMAGGLLRIRTYLGSDSCSLARRRTEGCGGQWGVWVEMVVPPGVCVQGKK